MRKIREKGLLTVFITIIFIISLSAILFIVSNSIAKEKSVEMEVLDKLNWLVPLGHHEYLDSFEACLGFLIFGENGHYGILNSQGKQVVPPIYSYISPYGQENYILCEGQGKFGYIDSFGRTVIPFVYDEAFDFVGDYALVSLDSRYQIIDKSGQVVFENSKNYRLYPAEKEGYFSFWEKENSEGAPVGFDDSFMDSPKGLLYVGREGSTDHGRYLSKIVIGPGKYKGIFQYSEGFWLTETMPHLDLRISVFLSDEDFQELFTDKVFHLAHPFNEGFAAVTTFVEDVDLANKQNLHIDKVGYMNHEGKILANDMTFNASTPFKEGLASVFDHKGLYYIDTSGEVVIEIPRKGNFIYSKESFSEGLACVKVDKHWGYIDKSGKFLVPTVFSDAFPVTRNVAVVVYGGKYGAFIMDNRLD